MSLSHVASRPDSRTLDAFLCQIMGSESGGRPDSAGLTGLSGSQSDSPAESGTGVGLRTDCSGETYGLSPAIRPEPHNEELSPAGLSLADLVEALADDVRELVRMRQRPPYGAGDLYVFFDRLIVEHGLRVAEAEAARRYRLHVAAARVGELPPLALPIATLPTPAKGAA